MMALVTVLGFSRYLESNKTKRRVEMEKKDADHARRLDNLSIGTRDFQAAQQSTLREKQSRLPDENGKWIYWLNQSTKSGIAYRRGSCSLFLSWFFFLSLHYPRAAAC